MQGGPGCSGATGILFENIGPFSINNNTQPVLNPYTWISDYHVIMIDFPLGAGFSYANAAYDMKNNTAQATAQLYNLLVKLAKKYPTWFDRDFYIFGESYAGHWIPGIAYTILMNNRSPTVLAKINLKGVGIGDPWTEAITQSQYYAEFAFSTGLINRDERAIIETLQKQVVNEINNQQWTQANNDNDAITDNIVAYSGGINVYNYRDYQTNYDLGMIPNWLGLASTKAMLNVPSSLIWDSCSDAVNDMFTEDIVSSAINYLPLMLEDIKVMIYNGQDDLLVNSMGTEALISKINWPMIPNFLQQNKQLWRVNGEIAGYAKVYNNLSFVLILKSGHLVPHDQPAAARDMLYRFINNEGWR